MQITVSIPNDARFLIKANQKVEFKTPFFEKRTRNSNILLISQSLGIPPKKIFKFLKKFVGDSVKKGDLIGIKKDLFSTKRIVSSFDGVIKEIDYEEGKIIIESFKDSNVFSTYFKGTVVELKKDRAIIKVESGKEYELKKAGTDFGGPTLYEKDISRVDGLRADQIERKILIFDSPTSFVLTKMEALGLKGMVSLRLLTEESHLPMAQLRSIDDFKQILSQQFPYCLVNQKLSKIYFYR